MSDYIKGAVDITAEEACFTPRYIELMENHYRKLVEEKRIFGAGFLLARNGKVFAHQSIGNLTYKDDSPKLEPQHIKGLASITKVFVATAIMKLVEEGKLWLEQPLSSLISEFDTDQHKAINIFHLLTHTSGLMADPGYFMEANPVDFRNMPDDTDILKFLTTGPSQSKPGECWSYSSMSFSVLAEIVSRASGVHFYDYVQNEIFAPLGMKDSYFEVPKERERDICQVGEWVCEELEFRRKRLANWLPAGGGGAWASMHDLFKFGQCYLNGGIYNGHRLLGKNTVVSMTKNRLENTPAYHWGANFQNYKQGLAWEFYTDGSTTPDTAYNHEGFGWCSLFIDPADKFIFISIVNDPSGWDPEVMVKPRVMAFAGVE